MLSLFLYQWNYSIDNVMQGLGCAVLPELHFEKESNCSLWGPFLPDILEAGIYSPMCFEEGKRISSALSFPWKIFPFAKMYFPLQLCLSPSLEISPLWGKLFPLSQYSAKLVVFICLVCNFFHEHGMWVTDTHKWFLCFPYFWTYTFIGVIAKMASG